LRPTDKQNTEWQFGQSFPPLLPTVTLVNLTEYIFSDCLTIKMKTL